MLIWLEALLVSRQKRTKKPKRENSSRIPRDLSAIPIIWLTRPDKIFSRETSIHICENIFYLTNKLSGFGILNDTILIIRHWPVLRLLETSFIISIMLININNFLINSYSPWNFVITSFVKIKFWIWTKFTYEEKIEW